MFYLAPIFERSPQCLSKYFNYDITENSAQIQWQKSIGSRPVFHFRPTASAHFSVSGHAVCYYFLAWSRTSSASPASAGSSSSSWTPSWSRSSAPRTTASSSPSGRPRPTPRSSAQTSLLATLPRDTNP